MYKKIQGLGRGRVIFFGTLEYMYINKQILTYILLFHFMYNVLFFPNRKKGKSFKISPAKKSTRKLYRLNSLYAFQTMISVKRISKCHGQKELN